MLSTNQLDTTATTNQLASVNDLTLIRMYSTTWCPDCFRAKKVMESMKVKFHEIDITNDESAAELVIRLNNGSRSVPTIVFPDGSILTEPSTPALVQKLQAMI